MKIYGEASNGSWLSCPCSWSALCNKTKTTQETQCLIQLSVVKFCSMTLKRGSDEQKLLILLSIINIESSFEFSHLDNYIILDYIIQLSRWLNRNELSILIIESRMSNFFVQPCLQFHPLILWALRRRVTVFFFFSCVMTSLFQRSFIDLLGRRFTRDIFEKPNVYLLLFDVNYQRAAYILDPKPIHGGKS